MASAASESAPSATSKYLNIADRSVDFGCRAAVYESQRKGGIYAHASRRGVVARSRVMAKPILWRGSSKVSSGKLIVQKSEVINVASKKTMQLRKTA